MFSAHAQSARNVNVCGEGLDPRLRVTRETSATYGAWLRAAWRPGSKVKAPGGSESSATRIWLIGCESALRHEWGKPYTSVSRIVKTLKGETACTFVCLDSLVVVALASSLHIFVVVEVSDCVYVWECAHDLLLFAICRNECGHYMRHATRERRLALPYLAQNPY